MVYCTHCGHENVDGAKFCIECGRNILSETVQEQRPAELIESPSTAKSGTASRMKKGCGISCGAFIALFIVLAIIGSIFGDEDESNSSDTSTSQSTATAQPSTPIPTSVPSSTSTQIVSGFLGGNNLGIAPEDLAEKANPQGEGTFVYVPQSRFSGVERFLIWVVIDGQAYPLNGATKNITPSLVWPREALDATWEKTGVNRFAATESIDFVFRGITPPTTLPTAIPATPTENFTVLEYRLYAAVIDTPLSISEEQAHRNIARDNNTTAQVVKETTTKVLRILVANGWLGTVQNEIRHASDWSGETR